MYFDTYLCETNPTRLVCVNILARYEDVAGRPASWKPKPPTSPPSAAPVIVPTTAPTTASNKICAKEATGRLYNICMKYLETYNCDVKPTRTICGTLVARYENVTGHPPTWDGTPAPTSAPTKASTLVCSKELSERLVALCGLYFDTYDCDNFPSRLACVNIIARYKNVTGAEPTTWLESGSKATGAPSTSVAKVTKAPSPPPVTVPVSPPIVSPVSSPVAAPVAATKPPSAAPFTTVALNPVCAIEPTEQRQALCMKYLEEYNCDAKDPTRPICDSLRTKYFELSGIMPTWWDYQEGQCIAQRETGCIPNTAGPESRCCPCGSGTDFPMCSAGVCQCVIIN